LVNIFLAFITGLTTGGLSCLAVQGGLLAGSLANQIEKDLQKIPLKKAKARKRKPKRIGLARPILAFLAAKLLAYSLLGFILGLVGQMFQLSASARAVFQIAIGIFMLGSAMRLFNVHPIFRYFAFEPPAFIRRRLRQAGTVAESSLAAPAFLGFLTVLIPCGITQAMMALALGTANPLESAALMFAFTLGTSPVFFAVAYFTTQLGSKLEKHFIRFVALVMLVLGVITVDGGITLAGSPISLTRLLRGASSQPVEARADPAADPGPITTDPYVTGLTPTEPAVKETGETLTESLPDGEVITVNVLDYGYEPEVVHAKAGVPVRLRLVSNNVYSCSLAFIIPSLGVEKYLKPTAEAWIDIPAQETGMRMPFSCSMGMFAGMIVFDL